MLQRRLLVAQDTILFLQVVHPVEENVYALHEFRWLHKNHLPTERGG
jgi:hypothetical protein